MHHEFDLTKFVNEVIEGQISINQLPSLRSLKPGKFDDHKMLTFFSDLSERKIYLNAKVAEKVADCCLVLNEEKNVESVSFEQIGKIYLTLIEHNPLDLDFCESYFYFLDAVMDQPGEARKVLSTGIKLVEQKLRQLRKKLEDDPHS